METSGYPRSLISVPTWKDTNPIPRKLELINEKEQLRVLQNSDGNSFSRALGISPVLKPEEEWRIKTNDSKIKTKKKYNNNKKL